MAVPPNLVVGLVGLVIFAGTGAVIVKDLDDLTGTRSYATDVRTFPREASPVSGTLGSGASKTETFPIADGNVTDLRVRVTWTETGLPIARHVVSVTVRDPRGTMVAEERGQGAGGVTVDRHFLDPPRGDRFASTDDALADEFSDRYPAREEGRGLWTIRVATDTPTQPGAGTTTYTITFHTDHYVVTYRPDVVTR